MNAVDYKCPACSAVLKYNPEICAWKCEYCGTEYRLEDLEENQTKYEEAETKTMDVDEYSCPNCGAKIVTDENTTATFCIYCGSTSIIKNRLVGVLEPDAVLPFKKAKEEAIEAFKKCKRGKIFAPKDFAQKEQIDKITGVYIPFWLYDCEANGNISCLGTQVSTWRAGDYRYTKTDTYRVIREGKAFFDKVPVDASQKFDDDTMDSIEPFEYEGLQEFSPSYLSGFLAEKYDVDSDDAYERAIIRVKNTFREELKKNISGYATINLESEDFAVDNSGIRYVLLPVWMLNIKYKDKMHLFAMNGQTGEMIGNIPIDLCKIFEWGIGVFSGLFGIITLLLCIL